MSVITDNKVDRLAGLRRFAVAISILNILGHTVFGFEQSWAHPLVGIGTAYLVEIILELIDCSLNKRKPLFLGGFKNLIDFLLSAHISGLAVSMLLYANERLFAIAFAAAVAIGSKAIFRIEGNVKRHFLNPSNFGITVTILTFPWIAPSPAYHFTEGLEIGDVVLPCVIILSGSILNTLFTHRIPLILTWVACFAIQAVVRSLFLGTPILAALMPMTGVAFILFTFYMLTDPATTPSDKKEQVIFGAATAFLYSLFIVYHVVFGLFFALTIVCILRGVYLYINSLKSPLPKPSFSNS
jgi:hypothetical protein